MRIATSRTSARIQVPRSRVALQRRRRDRDASSRSTIGPAELIELARDAGLDLERFEQELASEAVSARVMSDLEEGRKNGVTGAPTLFVDGIRYDGAWDYHALLEALERPIAARVHRR